MELEIRRREVTGTGGAKRTEVETLGKYEIMDGAPVRGESIPIRYRVWGGQPHEGSEHHARQCRGT